MTFIPETPGGPLPQSFTPPIGYFNELTKDTDGGYTLTDLTDLLIRKFDSNGYLLYEQDFNGNQTTLQYNSIQASVPPYTKPQHQIWVDDFNDTDLATNGVGLYTNDDNTLTTWELANNTLKAEWSDQSGYFNSSLNRAGNPLNISNFERLEFDFKGAVGGEDFNITLKCTNGNFSLPVRSATSTFSCDNCDSLSGYDLYSVYMDWLTVKIPLSEFAALGADINQVTAIQFDFNRQNSGTVWLDNIAFVESDPLLTPETYFVNRVTSIIDSVGRIVQLSYGANGKVASMTDPSGRQWLYSYDENNFLTSVTYPRNGISRQYSYYKNGNLKTYTDRNSNLYQMTYLYNDKIYQQTDPEGKITTFDYRWTTTEVFNNKGESWIYKFDFVQPHYYKLIYSLDPVHMFDINYTGKQNVWASNGLLAKEIDENGRSTKYEYDSRGNITKITNAINVETVFEYHPNFNKVTKQTEILSPSVSRLTTMIYDSNGNLLSITDPKNNTSSFSYTSDGQLATMTTPYGVVTYYGYNLQGDLTSVSIPGFETLSMQYDMVGRLLETNDLLFQTTTFTYDDADNLITMTDDANNVTTFEYDNNDNQTKVTTPNSAITTTVYNSYNEIASITDANGKITVFEYDGDDMLLLGSVNNTKITDADNNESSFIYNSQNQLVRINDASGYFLRFMYDYAGNLVKIINQNNETTEFIYNPLNQLWRKKFPDESYYEYFYDNVGNVVHKRSPNGAITTYDYDGNSNLIKIDYPSDTDVVFWYDKLNRPGWMTDASGRTDYVYDNANRLSQVFGPWANLYYTYNANGKRISIGNDVTNLVTYTYDSIKRLTSLTNQQNVFTYLYTSHTSAPERIDYANGSYSHIIRDSIDTVNRIVNYNSSNTVLSDFEYTRDNRYNITTEVQQNKTFSYAFDTISQLISRNESGGESIDYKYDPAGNHIDPISGNVTVTEDYSVPTPEFPTNNNRNTRSLWVRNHIDDPVNLLTDLNAQTALFDFCDAPHGDTSRAITRIYLAPGWHGENSFCENENDVASFIFAARQRGIEVYYSGGFYTWIVQVNGIDPYREYFINLVLNYNLSRQSTERFDGILEDIEPYNMESNDEGLLWPDDHFTIINRYEEVLTDIKTAVDAYELQTGTTLPLGSAIWTNYADDKLDQIVPIPDFIAIMNYKDSGQELITAAASEMSKASQYNKDIVLIFNTIEKVDPGDTFLEEGTVAMEQAINEFYTACSSYNQYNENGIFEYKTGYQSLPLNSSEPVDPVVTVSIQGTYSYNCDGNGNVTQTYNDAGELMTLSWNDADRLERVTFTSSGVNKKIEYLYNGEGKMSLRKYFENTITIDETRYVYDRWRIFEERDGANNLQKRYIWGTDLSGTFENAGGIGGLLGVIDYSSPTPEIYTYLYNGRGDIIQVISDSGVVVAEYDYDPFGKLTATSEIFDQNFGFSTKYKDTDSGLI